ncbi:PqqD family protein [Minwuia sp.]|uniref:PqqD family protein n=1 Tax=Minwuia sp. TaxID=2493630 RepID=UPI003A93B0E1
MKLQRAAGVTVSEMDGDLFLVRPESGEIWHLDAMGAAIWNAVEPPVARDELVSLFAAAFPDRAPGEIAGDVGRAVDALLDGALLEETGPSGS